MRFALHSVLVIWFAVNVGLQEWWNRRHPCSICGARMAVPKNRTYVCLACAPRL